MRAKQKKLQHPQTQANSQTSSKLPSKTFRKASKTQAQFPLVRHKLMRQRTKRTNVNSQKGSSQLILKKLQSMQAHSSHRSSMLLSLCLGIKLSKRPNRKVNNKLLKWHNQKILGKKLRHNLRLIWARQRCHHSCQAKTLKSTWRDPKHKSRSRT